ncbi:hypothetical protein ID866_10753 [Astraeus odoratus]|nr:hypothetical protein ID866_10753 [Astraeus odoratus]
MPYIIVNIASPPTGGLNLFILYVVLSRSSESFRQHTPELLAKDDRLDELNKKQSCGGRKWDVTPEHLKQ